ncbi:uncharacterized protein [Coffea arabica]|uniref:Reverse transcriptase domain-containing protein n=1 Tax=Coffea arabica TaxID=13443 RepID=A0ABM4W8N9_COFAR
MADNFLLAQELLSDIKKPNRGGNVLLKLDMMKAYDKGFFKSTRGLRQGDPISPALFVIGEEVLSRSLNALAVHRSFRPFKVPNGCPMVTHLAYADNVVIFTSGLKASMQLVKMVVDGYCSLSGQQVNCQKSYFLVHPRLPPQRREMIGSNLFMEKSGPIVWGQTGIVKKRVVLNADPFVSGSITAKGSVCVSRKGALCHRVDIFHEHMVSDFVTQAQWNMRLLNQMLESELGRQVVKVSPPAFRASQVWLQGCPLKISFFMLRLLWSRIPLMDMQRRFGVQGPSRCRCCFEPDEEGIQHTFCTGELAKAIWIRFEESPGDLAGVSTLSHLVFRWWLRQGHNEYLKFVYRVLPMLCRFPEIEGSFGSWDAFHSSLRESGVSGGGDVVRDREGKLIFGYSCFFGSLTSLHAELKAMLFGVQLCVAQGLHELHVESDSLSLVRILQESHSCPWRLRQEVDELLSYKQYFRGITITIERQISPLIA